MMVNLGLPFLVYGFLVFKKKFYRIKRNNWNNLAMFTFRQKIPKNLS